MSLTLVMRARAQFSATKKSLRLAVVHSLAPGLGWSLECTDKRFRHCGRRVAVNRSFLGRPGPKGSSNREKWRPGNWQATSSMEPLALCAGRELYELFSRGSALLPGPPGF